MRMTAKITTLTAAFALAAIGTGTASAQEAHPGQGPTAIHATLNGKAIDLKSSWNGADVCAVLSPTEVQCWDTAEAADRALGYNAATAVQGKPSCPKDWVCLYEDINGGGRRLQFSDEYWDNLYDYGFSNKTSSWYNHQDGWGNDRAWLANGRDGDGTQIHLDEAGYVSNLGSFNDKASSVYG